MSAPAVSRCRAHPGRVAHDRCPNCGSPRCAADVQQYLARCPVCAADVEPAPLDLPVSVARAGLAALAAAVAAAWIATQYVDTRVLSVVIPALLGLGVGTVTGSLLRHRPLAALVGGAAAWLGVALSFRLVPGADSVVGPAHRVLAPYLVAVVVAGGAAVRAPSLDRSAGSRRPPGSWLRSR